MSVCTKNPACAHMSMIVLWRDEAEVMVKEHDLAEPIYMPLSAVAPEREGLGRMLVSIPVPMARERGLI